MDSGRVLEELNRIFINVLDEEDIVLTRETTAADIEDWDSLTNIQLIVAVEKYFRIKFSTAEIKKLKNVGEMCDSIAAKKN